MKFTLNEIENWKEFEHLVEDYFKIIKNIKENNLVGVKVEASGVGSDGGRGILLTFRVDDSVSIYERKWIVQCKYYAKSLSKKHISDVNIPTLIHEYGANGYLLICKSEVTSKVSEMFENLRRNCAFRYDYEIWDGNELINKLFLTPQLYRKFFPKYNNYLDKGNVT